MPALSRIEISCFRYPLKKPLATVFGLIEARPSLILRIEDAEGAVGYGEIWCNFPSPGAEYRARLAHAVLPRALSGLSSDQPERAFATLRPRLHTLALQADEPGPADQISAGVDIALHDLAARRAGVPLATLLGGAPRPLNAYASGIGPPEGDALVETSLAAGFEAFKLRVGFGQDSDLAAIARARAIIGDDRKLMIDANQNWSLDEALAMAANIPEDLGWVEEPLPVDRPLGEWHRLAEASPVPLAGGENLRGEHQFSAAVEAGYLSVIQPDICKWGGLSGCATVVKSARAAGRTYHPHYLGGGVGLAASAHLLAACGGPDGILEVDVNDNHLREALAGPILPLRDGQVRIPDAPGLGYEPDLATLIDLRSEFFAARVDT